MYGVKYAEYPGLLSLQIYSPMSKGESLLGRNEQVPWECNVLLQLCMKRVSQERDVGQEPELHTSKDTS